ncbi:magnesium transporter [Hazenella sp. IB182357]|uniref:Magnesium transporter MgtE n=1 Tax=Polycladospora coralii TaxID=2771432 RepID=A0A926RTB9_9BACL|nr:magnesium transporter [Polycladospora coralii]MBD1370964.1 magnesium transporter [Polycladospora coralii]MBS7529903.1 magnesium transporter [Polycladospora coralii]
MEVKTRELEEMKELISYLQQRDLKSIRTFIDELHPYDLGQYFFSLNEIHRRRLLTVLMSNEIADLLQELDLKEQKEVIIALGAKKTADVLNLMPSDDTADLLAELDDTKAQKLLTDMEIGEADKVRALLRYPEDTAGGIMTNEYVSIFRSHTVETVISFLRKEAPTAETVYYLYVLDFDRTLVGVVSLRDILISSPETTIDDIMYERVISVPADMDQEEAAQILERYDFLALPVVDEHHRLLGIITVDDVIDVLIEEAQEDISNLSAVGVTDKEIFVHPLLSARRRIPWLLLLLVIGMATANLLVLFEGTMDALPVLVLFMPMIAGMTGNTATQSLGLIIRGLSNQQVSEKNYRQIIRQEGFVGGIIGLICSVFIIIMISIWKNSIELGVVVGGSLFFTLLIGTLVGTLIPLVLNQFKIDPTVASGPLITTLNDVLSLMVYYGLATLFIQYLL